MRFTVVDVVYVSNNVNEAFQAFVEVSQKLPNKYTSCHMTISELLASDNMPYALLVLVTQDILTSPMFADLSEYILKKMNSSDGRNFRVYMVPYGISHEEFMNLLDRGTNQHLNNIGDVVHLDAFKDKADLIGEVIRFLNNQGNASRFYAYVNFRDVFKFFIGFISGLVMLGCSVAAYILSLLYFLHDSQATWAVSVPYQWITNAIGLNSSSSILFSFQMLLGTSLIIPITNFLFLLRFGFSQFIPQLLSSLKGLKGKLYFIATCLGFVLTILYICAAVQPGIGTFVLSLTFGFCIDGIRRLYYQGNRGFIVRHLDKSLCSRDKEKLNRNILNSSQRSILNALRISYLPAKRARIFISYTHSCDWSKKIVDRMYRQFSQDGLICFVDKHGISRGSSWRRALHEKMSDATHVICVASEHTVHKEWPAAELEAALRMRAITGSPTITIILPESLDEREIDKITIVYKEVFDRQDDKYSFIHTIRETDEGVLALSHSLTRHDAYSGLLGSVFHHLWRVLFDFAEYITLIAKNYLTIILGICFLGYLMYIIVGNFTDIRSLEAFIAICASIFTDAYKILVSSWFRLPIYLLACYFLSVETVSILDDMLLVGYKSTTKTYLISKMIVLSLSAMISALLFPYTSFVNYILGFFMFIAGGFLASSANRTQVEINGVSYYRNDANKGMVKLPPLFSPNVSSYSKEFMTKKDITRATVECMDAYQRKRVNTLFHASESFGKGIGDTELMKLREAYLRSIAVSEDFADSKRIIFFGETIGDISVYLGCYDDAVYYYRKAISYLYAIFNLTRMDDLRLAQCYCNLALLCNHNGEDEKAKKYARIALSISNAMDDHITAELNKLIYDH